MAYNNFLTRTISSVFLISVYFYLYLFYPDKIIYFVTVIYAVIFIEILIFFKRYKFFIISYILISFFCFFLYFYFNFNPVQFTIIILCISFFDSACYLAGKRFGKNKILLHISPNKTYEGLFGGILVTNLICLTLYFNIDLSKISLNLFILNNLVIIFSFFGDLIQSYFKRLNYLKDSGNFIPGHGGFFDRFDSFLLVIIPISFLNLIF